MITGELKLRPRVDNVVSVLGLRDEFLISTNYSLLKCDCLGKITDFESDHEYFKSPWNNSEWRDIRFCYDPLTNKKIVSNKSHDGETYYINEGGFIDETTLYSKYQLENYEFDLFYRTDNLICFRTLKLKIAMFMPLSLTKKINNVNNFHIIDIENHKYVLYKLPINPNYMAITENQLIAFVTDGKKFLILDLDQ